MWAYMKGEILSGLLRGILGVFRLQLIWLIPSSVSDRQFTSMNVGWFFWVDVKEF